MAYEKIGVVGATGRLGTEITRALAKEGFEVVPFSRQEGATVANIPTQQLGSLKGFDVVVSAVGYEGFGSQEVTMKRARADGVKRFIPSEFGTDHRELKFPIFDGKKKFEQTVREASFPDGFTSISSGFFDWCTSLTCHLNEDTRTATVSGSGRTQIPFTSQYDIGRALAETFRNPEKYRDTWVTVVSSWMSGDEIARGMLKGKGEGWKIEHVPVSDKAPVLKFFEEDDVGVNAVKGHEDKWGFEMTDLRKVNGID